MICPRNGRSSKSQSTTPQGAHAPLFPYSLALTPVPSSSSCWVIIENKVYDVTEFLPVRLATRSVRARMLI